MMVDIQGILQDRNGDGVIDYVNAKIYVADNPLPAELAAASNIAARLAFESLSLDLPIGATVSAFDPSDGRIAIAVGGAADSLSGDHVIAFRDTEEAEDFARTAGLNSYRRAPGAPGNPHSQDASWSLGTFFDSQTHVVLGRDVRATAVIDLAARIALEATSLRLPLVTIAGTGEERGQGAILLGRTLPQAQAIAKHLSAGHGRIELVELANGETAIVIVGADAAGESEAIRHAAERLPYVWNYGKEFLSLSMVRREAHRALVRQEQPADSTIFEDHFHMPWEVDRALAVIEEKVLPGVTAAAKVKLELRVSEPPEIRVELQTKIRRLLIEKGADPEGTTVAVLCAHKQGYSWICDALMPRLQGARRIRIRFRELTPAENSVDSPIRWLQELYPIDEVLARDLAIPLEDIAFERLPQDAPHTYEVIAEKERGKPLLRSTFDPMIVSRPLFDVFPTYAHALVATGWIRATSGNRVLADERIHTDPELFWDTFQSETLSRIHDYVLDLYNGKPDPDCAPHFGELNVELSLSEPDFKIGIDQERVSTLEALHEDIYFQTLLFFDVLGLKYAGKRLNYPGRIIPRVQPSRPGPGSLKVRFTGRRTPRPHDAAVQAPRILGLTVKAGADSVARVDLGLDCDMNAALGIPSYEKIDAVRLLCRDGVLTVPYSESPRAFRVPKIVPDGKNTGAGIVQWDSPIGPQECEQIIRRLSAFPEVRPFYAGASFLGRNIWAMDVMAPVDGKYFSQAKAIASKPAVFITGRQHANEVSSTSHILRFVELLATRTEYRQLLDRVNFIIHPITNPDGAALVEELERRTPDFMLHACYRGALGEDVTDQQWDECPKYPEARIRADLWRMWQPDVLLNPHGYPSHEWVQLFAGYTAWVRSKTMMARDWWIPRGWFLPGLVYAPDRKHLVFRWLEEVEKAVHASMGELNARMYERYTRYGSFDPETYAMCFRGNLLAYLEEKEPSSHSRTTWLNVVSEAPDEVVRGDWLAMVAKAGLEVSVATARFLAAGEHIIERTVERTSERTLLHIRRSDHHEL